jgi:hypothetical protein
MPFLSDSNIRKMRVTLFVCACAVFCTASLFAQGEQVFSGQIKQCACPQAREQAATTAKAGAIQPCEPPCTNAGTKYVLTTVNKNVAFQLDKQDFAKAYDGAQVYVIGVLDKPGGTIHVNNIVADLPPKIKRAKTVAVVCDACPRAMSKVKLAAFEEFTVWKRFVTVQDPKAADLIFLFSANPYLGDYLTRDGPDTRVVHVETVYLNVLDPHTGESLWGDHNRVGSWFVSSATKDLISEVRERLEVEVNPAERKLFVERNRAPKALPNLGK